jgi:hypothetical protein
MTCRDVCEALDALLDDELNAAEESEVRHHLEGCPSCARELEETSEWHGTLSDAFALRGPEPTPADRRKIADAVVTALRRRSYPLGRLAALVAIGLSVGVVAAAVAFSRPPEGQIARVVERLKEREIRDAQLRALDAEIRRDLGEAGKVVADRGEEDPAALAVAVASWNIARQLGPDRLPEIRRAPAVDRVISDLQGTAASGERVSISRTIDGATVSVVQLNDGRVRVSVPGGRFEARTMAELMVSHADVCRIYAIRGSDGFLSVGDSGAGVDWKGRLDLMFRTGTWDENTQWEAYRGWVAGRAPDKAEIERRVKEHQERCRAAEEKGVPPPGPVNLEGILKNVKGLTRAELQRAQERVEAEMKKLDARLKQAGELRSRARGLRIFAEDVTRD